MKHLSLLFIALLLLQIKLLAQEEFLIDTISTVTCEQFNPTVSSDGNKFIVFWEDNRLTPINLHGAVLNEQGIFQNKTLILNHNHREQPAVDFDGSNFFVVHEGDAIAPFFGWELRALCYDTNGELIYPYDIKIEHGDESSISNLKICFGLSNYLVGYINSAHRSSMGVHIVYPNGQLGNYFYSLDVDLESVSFDGENYFIVRGGPRGCRVDTSGAVIDSSWIQISPGMNGGNSSVAFDGTNYLVVWQSKDSLDYYDIYCARVTPSGEVLDTLGFPISIADSNQVNPEIAFDGENYVVVWEDYRNGPEADIYCAKVDTAGNVIDSFPISTKEGDQIQPALVKGSGNKVLVVYSGWTGEYQGKTYNSMRIWGKILDGSTDVKEDKGNNTVNDFNLKQNYPNPFNSATAIQYSIPQRNNVLVKVYDILGNEIETLVNEEKPTGTYEISWNATNLGSGIYFYRIQAVDPSTGSGQSFVETKKMVLMK